MLSQFLSDTFPEFATCAMPDECWVAKAIDSGHPCLNVLSEAILVVEQGNELEALKLRVRREHPVDRAHNEQYDTRVRDCLAEACAFAWASLRGLESPKFTDAEGTPDIVLDTGRWIEVKAIHNSQEDHARMEEMLKGKVASGQVTEPSLGLYGKFKSSLLDAVKKFARQDQHNGVGPNVVFFNLTNLDTPQMLIEETVLDSLNQWAERSEEVLREFGDVKIVMCLRYDWKVPFRDPFNIPNQAWPI